MSITMASPASAARSDWQPGHVPRLSYRNPLPPGESLPARENMESPTIKRSNGPGLSIREIREALPQYSPTTPIEPQTPSSPAQTPKSKRKIFGGLFDREPTLTALGQVNQQYLTQYGSISPKVIPHVSSQKMPEHVPKVNTKWDGVPEYVKMKEKQEREKIKAGDRNSLHPLDTRSRTSDMPDDFSFIRRRNSNAASVVESWDSRSTGSRPVFQDNISMRPESIYSTSSSGSIRPAQRPVSITMQSYGSTSSSKSPKSSYYHLSDVSIAMRAPHQLQSSQNTSVQSVSSFNRSLHEYSPKLASPPADVIPEYTSSSATTPLERSPQTPAPFSDEENRLDALLRSEAALLASATSTNGRANDSKSKATPKARRPSGLGLHTGNQVAPWEAQELPKDRLKPTQSTTLASPRSKLRLFGRDKK